MSEPTDEQIIRCLATFEGWRWVEELNEWQYQKDGVTHAFRDYLSEQVLPDYMNDLNAMHAIESELEKREGLVREYLDALCDLEIPRPPDQLDLSMEVDVLADHLEFGWTYHESFRLVTATARQRALAAYQTITEHGEKGRE